MLKYYLYSSEFIKVFFNVIAVSVYIQYTLYFFIQYKEHKRYSLGFIFCHIIDSFKNIHHFQTDRYRWKPCRNFIFKEESLIITNSKY